MSLTLNIAQFTYRFPTLSLQARHKLADLHRTTCRCHSRCLTDWCLARQMCTLQHTHEHTCLENCPLAKLFLTLSALSTMSIVRLLVELQGRKYLPRGFDRILDLATAHRAKMSVSIGRVGSCRAGLLPASARCSLLFVACRHNRCFFACERNFIGLINLPC